MGKIEATLAIRKITKSNGIVIKTNIAFVIDHNLLVPLLSFLEVLQLKNCELVFNYVLFINKKC